LVGNRLSVLIGGEAGAGITRSGFLLEKACVRGGLSVFGMNDYGYLIRSGHNFFLMRIEQGRVLCPRKQVDLLVALNDDTVLRHRDDVVDGGGVLHDPDQTKLSDEEIDSGRLHRFPVPLDSIVKELVARPESSASTCRC